MSIGTLPPMSPLSGIQCSVPDNIVHIPRWKAREETDIVSWIAAEEEAVASLAYCTVYAEIVR